MTAINALSNRAHNICELTNELCSIDDVPEDIKNVNKNIYELSDNPDDMSMYHSICDLQEKIWRFAKKATTEAAKKIANSIYNACSYFKKCFRKCVYTVRSFKTLNVTYVI